MQFIRYIDLVNLLEETLIKSNLIEQNHPNILVINN